MAVAATAGLAAGAVKHALGRREGRDDEEGGRAGGAGGGGLSGVNVNWKGKG